MSSSPTVVIRLPPVAAKDEGDEGENALIKRYRAFRLQSLQTDSESFASSYVDEVQHGDGFWRDRLSNPKSSHFVAIPESQNVEIATGALHLSEAQWKGTTALLGPYDEQSVGALSASKSPWPVLGGSSTKHVGSGSKASTPRYHIGSTYTDPAARGQGVGGALMRAVLAAGHESCRQHGVSDFRCTLYVEDDNLPARRVYEKGGFSVVGTELFTPRPIEKGARSEKAVLIMEVRSKVPELDPL